MYQGSRRYSPIRQATTQQVMIKTISKGPTSVLIAGSLTNLAIFLMSNSHLKSNIDHIYIMGGGVRSKSSSCQPQQCCDCGNIFTAFRSNPYAELNFFCDPFAAYQVTRQSIKTPQLVRYILFCSNMHIINLPNFRPNTLYLSLIS